MTNLRIVSEPRGDAGDATFVRESLALFNVAVTGDAYYSPLAIFLKDERGAVLGGALGHIWGGGSTSRRCGWRSRFAGRGTEGNSSGPPKTKPGCRDVTESS